MRCNKLSKRQHLFLDICFVPDWQEPNSTQPNEPGPKGTQGHEWRGNTRNIKDITTQEHALCYLRRPHHL